MLRTAPKGSYQHSISSALRNVSSCSIYIFTLPRFTLLVLLFHRELILIKEQDVASAIKTQQSYSFKKESFLLWGRTNRKVIFTLFCSIQKVLFCTDLRMLSVFMRTWDNDSITKNTTLNTQCSKPNVQTSSFSAWMILLSLCRDQCMSRVARWLSSVEEAKIWCIGGIVSVKQQFYARQIDIYFNRKLFVRWKQLKHWRIFPAFYEHRATIKA